ncbi:potassium channel family protein [Anoxybacillus ayderensis]|uniref:Ion channel n=1 Tax=Anoxybacillus ayderensis TaxID=265546 RepID=A0A0D0HR01_9BACL|nr:potassium channel family protein [Anoxybacillus ayderensis]NNU97075.1 two pore domain potassium channel family protein [Anoxybacillus sp. EFIL]EPZ37257.1 Ion transport protein [Anoxybacillus ayderensis]KIP20278.1 Ion channel [Anoxybacillus ayderensis]MBA2879422.1 potassium channel LctB [Anoxybacillus ayderensis]MCL6616913.1 potassium channel family protein [Anoxybacillus ayderensis]
MTYIWIGIIAFIICMSFFSFWQTKRSVISIKNFIAILFVYSTTMIGFALVYTILHINGHVVMMENGKNIEASNFLQYVETSLYFSAVTLLSVGYGDVVPIGIGRWIAMVEALLGYALPAAFVVRTVMDVERR